MGCMDLYDDYEKQKQTVWNINPHASEVQQCQHMALVLNKHNEYFNPEVTIPQELVMGKFKTSKICIEVGEGVVENFVQHFGYIEFVVTIPIYSVIFSILQEF